MNTETQQAHIDALIIQLGKHIAKQQFDINSEIFDSDEDGAYVGTDKTEYMIGVFYVSVDAAVENIQSQLKQIIKDEYADLLKSPHTTILQILDMIEK